MKKDKNYFYLIGDLNLPHINWNSLSCNSDSNKIFLDFCINSGLQQFVSESTHKSGSTLDLLICNHLSSRRIISTNVLPPFMSSCDHNVIHFGLHFEHTKISAANIPEYYRYDDGNYQEINQTLSRIDWDYVFTFYNHNVQHIYDHFLFVIHRLIELHIPVSKYKTHIRQPKRIKRAARLKNRTYQLYKHNKKYKNDYVQSSKLYDKMVSNWYESIENKICKSQSSSNFYKYSNKKLKLTSTIPPIKTCNNQTITDDSEKATLFNEFFQSTFVSDDGKSLNLDNRIDPALFLNEFDISEKLISQVIRSLPNKSSRTPDDLPYSFIKRINPNISIFLSKFYNLSLQTSTVPWQWKCTLITPLHKKG